ncbi:KUP/HAK/KT family potassium transporter [Limosilactobacillus equigenerosi]|nr:KUP/HAK/KT family potassium transporter [Limosilactobacillus equigenerosi]
MERKKTKLLANSLIALGIVYGDIGTSPLYVMNALINNAGGTQYLTPSYIVGCISLVFWTLMLITTIKYVLIALRADNKGEGGIFALFALVRRQARWLIVPAMIGGAALLADGTLTPAVTVTSAIEGLKHVQVIHSQDQVILITFVILLVLFSVQHFGTSIIGHAFGPLMVIWFSFLAWFGFTNLLKAPIILKALSPLYGLQLLFSPTNHAGILILGSVFLATTGAEALYSDLGHVGRSSIYTTWPIVCTALTLNYLGQGAFLIHQLPTIGIQNPGYNPFYQMLPESIYLFGVLIATIAAIIASQALITGSFTLVEEAIALQLLPRLQVRYPTSERGQIYIGKINWILLVITSGILFYFRTSAHMEAAYGLAITLTMLMTTILLSQYLKSHVAKPFTAGFLGLFATIETLFLVASLAKFIHGGYVTALLTMSILTIMICWYAGNYVRNAISDQSKYLNLLNYKQQLQSLSQDQSIPLFATNLVMMARINHRHLVKRETLYSILDKTPKRAKVYWFITVNTTDKPDTCYYNVDMMGTKNIISIQLYLGFKMPTSINLYLRQIIHDLIKRQIIDSQPQQYTTTPNREVGDFKFVFIKEEISPISQVTGIKRWLIQARLFLQNHTLSPVKFYGLEFSQTIVETIPLFIHHQHTTELKLNHLQK